MKNLIKILLPALFLIISIGVFGQNKKAAINSIPSEIQNYVKNHFPNLSIVEVEMDYDDGFKEYEIELNDGTDLEFNHEFNIIKVDGKKHLPNSVIPHKITQYINDHYPNQKITDWEMKRNMQEVKLNNDIELEFDLNGDFIRID